jgi:small subunit ribosomal protein S6
MICLSRTLSMRKKLENGTCGIIPPWYKRQTKLAFRSRQALRAGPGAIPRKGGNSTVRNYELVFIVHPDLDDNAFKDIVEKVQGWITESGGSVAKVDLWGKRKMAYPIRKQRDGQYVLFNTQMDPTFSATLERNLRLTEPVMRFLLTTVD